MGRTGIVFRVTRVVLCWRLSSGCCTILFKLTLESMHCGIRTGADSDPARRGQMKALNVGVIGCGMLAHSLCSVIVSKLVPLFEKQSGRIIMVKFKSWDYRQHERPAGVRNSRFYRRCLYGVIGVIIGLFASEHTQGAATNRYVATNAASVWPYDSWANAATNIKYAVDAANSNDAGDNVIISNGTYYLTEAIVVSNAVVTNYSGDRTKVTINGNYPAVTNRCFIMLHANAVISGFTITNGWAATNDLTGSGGGVYASLGRVHNCLITGCRSEITELERGGGGIYVGSSTTDFCSVIGNICASKPGSNPGLTTRGGGGGVKLSNNDSCITNCIVAWNTATQAGGIPISGGGISATAGIRINNCTIVSNSAVAYGGGVYFRPWTHSAEITHSTIAGNNSGIFIWGDGMPSIINCLIAENTGAGISCYAVLSPRRIESCTIVSNTYGIYYCSNCTGTKTNVRNCIIYYNGGGTNVYDDTGGLLTTSVTYSCVAPGSGFEIDGVVTNEPLFVDSVNDNYRLKNGSPCINKGTNMTWATAVGATDLGGDPRIIRHIIDMGAYEWHPPKGTVFSLF